MPIVRANKIIGTRSYLWDITDRKLVEKEAEKHKVYFETLIEHAPEAIVIQNTDGIIANINNEFVRTFGFDREESIGKHIDELITPEGFLKESKMLSQMVFDEGKIYAETRRSTKTGEMINVSILAAPIEINNQLQGHYTIFRDITQKKHNEEELARYRKGLEELVSLRTEELNKINRELSESREEYKLLAENVTDNIFILDLKSRRYSYSSPSIEMITGFTPEDIKTKYMNELFERNSYLLAKKMILEELKRYRDISGPKKGNEIVELQHLTVNGGYVWVEVTGKLMCDSSGKPDRILCTMRISAKENAHRN